MSRVKRLLINNACYHIYSRGNQKQRIFKEDTDFKNYLFRLKKYKMKHGFLLYSYCIMPNHVHIVGEIKKSSNLPYFMHDLTRSYTEFFNKKYTKVGYLWQGRFKSKVITKDRYLIDCVNYVELNPVRAGLVKSPADWLYSSYKERVLGIKTEVSILNNIVL